MLRQLLPIFASVATVAPALATDRYYPDCSAISPSGQYRIDAKSPDNAGARPRPFAANFTYTLTDTKTNKVIWERKQPMKREKGSSYSYPEEGSPTGLYVTDEGLVVVEVYGQSIIILDQKSGSKRAAADILNAFPKKQHDQYVSMSTAGPIWQRNADWFFVQVPATGALPAETLFVVRPFWNHRLVVDCESGKHLDLGDLHAAASPDALKSADDRTRRILTAIMNEESARARKTLASTKQTLKDSTNRYGRMDVGTALHTVGFRNLVELEPQMRELETWLATQPEEHYLATELRESLRWIGKVPKPGCGVQLYEYVDKGQYITHDTSKPYTAAVPTEARNQNAPLIKAGMSMRQVCDLIGCPDDEVYDQGHGYDYDIDATPPYTLRIIPNTHEIVESVRIIKPFAFLHDPARMRR